MKALKRTISIFLVLFLSFGVVPSWMNTMDVVQAFTPDYTVSDSYKKGPYYQKLQSVTLGSNQAKNIVKIAESQVGYHSGSSVNDLSGTSTGSNFTEYQWRFNKGNESQAWCAYFVMWCARQARIPTSLIPNEPRVRNIHWNAPGYKDISSGYEPKPGDLFFLEPTGGKSKRYVDARKGPNGQPELSGHVGIVVDYDKNSKRMWVVHGNNGNKVCRDSYVLDFKRGNRDMIQGFLSVNYAGAGAEDVLDNMVDEIKIKVNTTGADSITTTNAIVRGTLTKPSAATRIATIGLYLGTSSTNLTKRNSETVSDGANNKDNGMGFNIWYNLTDELGITLKPNTTYYYQIYATYGGQEYKGEILSFKTKGTTLVYDRNVRILVPENYGKVQCYETVDSTTNYRYFNAQTYPYYIYATKYADLSNGKRRFYCTSGDGYSMWFDYNSAFTVEYAATSIVLSETNIVAEAGETYYIYVEATPVDANESLRIGLNDEIVSSNSDMNLHRNGKIIQIYGYRPSTAVGYVEGKTSKIKTYFNIEIRDTIAPSNFYSQILSQSNDKFAACCSPTDFVGVSDVGVELLINNEVVMPLTWASEGASLVNENGDWYYYVNASDFGNRSGKYTLVFYAKDKAGNVAQEQVSTEITPQQIDYVYASGIQSGITVTWNALENVEGYVVYRKDATGDWEEIGKTITNTFVDNSAFAGVTYYYAVSGFQSYENSYDDGNDKVYVTGTLGEYMSGVSFEAPKEEPVTPQKPNVKPLNVGSYIQIGNLKYKVTSNKLSRPTVTVCGVRSKSIKKITIPESVVHNEIEYYVTSISSNAFKNNKSIKQLHIGTNVESIGKKAFFNCKKLKKVYLFTDKLANRIGNKAFKNCHSKAKVFLLDRTFKKYKKLLLKKGFSKKTKFVRSYLN